MANSTHPSQGLTEQEFRQISTVKISREQRENGFQCSICLEPFIAGEIARNLSCSHIFHDRCIKLWLEHNKNCPVCRREVMIESQATGQSTQSRNFPVSMQLVTGRRRIMTSLQIFDSGSLRIFRSNQVILSDDDDDDSLGGYLTDDSLPISWNESVQNPLDESSSPSLPTPVEANQSQSSELSSQSSLLETSSHSSVESSPYVSSFGESPIIISSNDSSEDESSLQTLSSDESCSDEFVLQMTSSDNSFSGESVVQISDETFSEESFNFMSSDE